MYDNLHLDTGPALHDIEPALLWSVRAWVIGFSRGIEVQTRIAQVWSNLGVPEAAFYVDGIMFALSCGVTRVVEVNCVCNPEVSGDEATLLDLVAQQMPQENKALLELLGMATPNAALAVCDSATRLRSVLVRAGHALPSATAARQGKIVAFPRHVGGHGSHTIH